MALDGPRLAIRTYKEQDQDKHEKTVEDVNLLREVVTAITNGDWDRAAYQPTLDGDVVHKDLQETVKAMVRQLL